VEQLAEGGFGVVHRAVHHKWGTVVYKELKSTFIKNGTKFVLFVHLLILIYVLSTVFILLSLSAV